MPPTSAVKPVSDHVRAWRGQSAQQRNHSDIGPMAVQQQQPEREPHQQRLVPQRNSGTKSAQA